MFESVQEYSDFIFLGTEKGRNCVERRIVRALISGGSVQLESSEEQFTL